MNWKLDVDVHVAAGSDGMMLVVGGLIRPLTGQELESILSGKPLKQGKRARAPKKTRMSPASHKRMASAAKEAFAKKAAAGICVWCEKKAASGKRLCAEHLKQARERSKKGAA